MALAKADVKTRSTRNIWRLYFRAIRCNDSKGNPLAWYLQRLTGDELVAGGAAVSIFYSEAAMLWQISFKAKSPVWYPNKSVFHLKVFLLLLLVFFASLRFSSLKGYFPISLNLNATIFFWWGISIWIHQWCSLVTNGGWCSQPIPWNSAAPLVAFLLGEYMYIYLRQNSQVHALFAGKREWVSLKWQVPDMLKPFAALPCVDHGQPQ